MFDGHEDAMALGVVELKILGACAVGRLEKPGSDVTAEAMSGMKNQLTGVEWGDELSWQLYKCTRVSPFSNLPCQGTSVAAGRPAAVRVAPALAIITSAIASRSENDSR